MKIKDIFDDVIFPNWNDYDLQVTLESARSNLMRLRKIYPDKYKNISDNPKSGRAMLAKAKELHARNKSASMMFVAIESYAEELNLDPDIKLLLENMVEEE